jgi:membrane-bound metal-dependent hydrolase YbcI (DUF457 family)
MTTIEHALLGTNLVFATGLEKRFGWQTVALGGVCAVAPDWDGLTLLWSVSLFDIAHRVWGHNLLVCSVVALLIAAFDYRCDFITRTARQLVQWTKFALPANRLTIRTVFSWSQLAVWLCVALVASWSHLVGDLVFSGTATLSDWAVKLFWPFTDDGFVYPLISWGDVGVTIIFVLGMFAMLRWKNKTVLIARLTLLVALGYIIL